jgi:sugar phosphate isomerase/epimerase
VLEAATAWAGDDHAAITAEAEQFARLVEEHGSPLVSAVTMAPSIVDVDAARGHLAALAARVEPLGARVCVEFFAWSAIRDLQLAWDLVEPLPRVGLVLDTFHWVRQRGGPDLDALRAIPGDRIMYVQLADATREPSGPSEAEAMTSRLLPGDGVVDFASLFEVLTDIGAAPFIATEVFNTALAAERGPLGAAIAMRDAGTRVLPPRIAT